MDEIEITEPVVIRGYTPGGKGGYGFSSTPLHRLVTRTPYEDRAACGWVNRHGKYAVTEGRPNPKQVAQYGVCTKCWPASA